MRPTIILLVLLTTLVFCICLAGIICLGLGKPDVTGPIRCTCVEVSPADAAPIDVLTPEKP